MNESELILTTIRQCRRVDLYADPEPLSGTEAQCFDAMQARRKSGEPIQYILGECEFMGFTVKVDPRVLIPRPETEILVEQVLLAFKGREDEVLKILDIGTGSGNIAIALAKNLPNPRVTSIDISVEAIQLAKENAILNGIADRIDFIQADMIDFLRDKGQGTGGRFNLIISNPPYVASDQLDYLSLEVRREPRLALDGGIDGIKFYAPIISASERLLAPGGSLFLEFGDGQEIMIQEIFKKHPEFSSVQFMRDSSAIDRIVVAQL